MSKKIFKNGLMLSPFNKTIDGVSVAHLEKSSKYKSLMHTTSNDAFIILPLVDAAINLAQGNISVARTNYDDALYIEYLMSNGNICSLLFNEETEELTYEFDKDLIEDSFYTPIAALYLVRMLLEKGSNELMDAYKGIQSSVLRHDAIRDENCYILCDYFTCRMSSKMKANLDIDIVNIYKTRNISMLSVGDGMFLTITLDITSKFTGENGVFERISCSSDVASEVVEDEEMLGKGNYALHEELTDAEIAMIPNLTGVIERREYVDTIELFYDSKDANHPFNNFFAAGTSGCGKSFFPQVMAMELGVPFFSISASDELSDATVKGGWKLKDNGTMYYELSPLAQRVSRPCVIEVAEASAAFASRLTAIYDWLDRDKGKMIMEDGTVVKRHPHCVFVFTCNLYSSMNEIAPSLVARANSIIQLPMLKRNDIERIILREIDYVSIDADIMNNILDCLEKLEDYLKSPQAPRKCESSMRAYAYWALQTQKSRDKGRYNPIQAARNTILPVTSCGIGFDSSFQNTIIDSIISPTFNFFENGGV